MHDPYYNDDLTQRHQVSIEILRRMRDRETRRERNRRNSSMLVLFGLAITALLIWRFAL